MKKILSEFSVFGFAILGVVSLPLIVLLGIVMLPIMLFASIGAKIYDAIFGTDHHRKI